MRSASLHRLQFLKICKRRRLWQRQSPATPENSAAFLEGELENSLFRFIYFKTGSKADAQVSVLELSSPQ